MNVMRTTERMIDLDLARPGQPLLARIASAWTALRSAHRAWRNRMSVGSLQDLDDHQLQDIGLSRSDVANALFTSTFFEDPSHQLMRTVARRNEIPR